MWEIVFYIIAGLVVLTGIVGIFIPGIPGVPLVFAGMLIAMIAAKFSFISILAVVILSILAVTSVLIDYLSGFIGAKYSGASTLGLLGVLVGVIFGVTIFGVIGIFIGPALGVLIFELLAKKKIKPSAKIAGYTLLSTIAGILINLITALIMIGIFVGAIFLK